MTSVPLYNYSNQVSSSAPSPSLSSMKILHRSTAQMRLEKILQIISSHSRDSSNESFLLMNRGFQHSESESKEIGSFDGIEIDLNLRLGPVPDDPTAESGIGKSDDCHSFPESGEVTTVEKSSQGECDPKTDNTEENEEARDVSEITKYRGKTSRDSEEEENRVEEAEKREESNSKPIISTSKEDNRNEGYLNLLLEAVRQISGDFEDEPPVKEPEPEPKPEAVRCRCRSKRKPCCCWMIDFYGGFEDIAPVVRSKRGRNQVLPYRFRDSVLEPWKRLARQK